MNIKKYKVGEIYGILEKIYNDPVARRTTVPLFMSNAGLGKTYIIEEFMKDKGVYKPPFVLSQRMPFEVSGMAMAERAIKWVKPLLKGFAYIFNRFIDAKVIKDFNNFVDTLDDKSGDKMKYYDFDFLLELKDNDILFIDETYAANPTTLSAFLTFLESRIMISGRKLPDIMIVAAANPQGMPVLPPQTRRRFLQYDIEFDNNSFKKYMLNKYQMPVQVSNKLASLIKDEDFTGYNFDTSADIDKNVHFIIQNIPTPYEAVLKPILSTNIKNTKGRTQLAEDVYWEKDEMLPWLKLKQYGEGIDLSKIIEDEDEVKSNSNSYEIEIIDCQFVCIGEIRNIEVLKSMYTFHIDTVADLIAGNMISVPHSNYYARLKE